MFNSLKVLFIFVCWILPCDLIQIYPVLCFLSCIFLFVSFHFFVCGWSWLSPPPSPPCAGCKTAVEFRWEVRELRRHQGEAIFVCVCVCVYVLALLSGLIACDINLLHIMTTSPSWEASGESSFLSNHCAVRKVPPLNLVPTNCFLTGFSCSEKPHVAITF